MKMKIMSPLTLLFTNNQSHTRINSRSLSHSLSLSFLKIPILFLQGLHTYIHPDDVNPSAAPNGSLRAAIRRPVTSDHQELKPRKRSKEKFEFDENKAQIFRLKLTDGHLQTRLYLSS